ncbi:MAG: hypothetical protein JXA99_02155 [Candidatus Lokiarchaeota archaeon]|nr:hypothetical protein [Candidatus Lokiarchaeota archaeon]
MVKKNTRVCSGCIDEFEVSKMYVALVPNRNYFTCYCKKCIDKLDIKIYKPFNKPRK